MATSSITVNFVITDPKAYLPSEASFAKQSGYSSARAFVYEMAWCDLQKKSLRYRVPQVKSIATTN